MLIHRAPLLWFLGLIGVLVAAASYAAGADPDDPEGVGSDMGYRLYGDAKKNKPLLLQNSRPFPVEVFEDQRGVYFRIPAYSSRDFPCEGKSRLLHIRFIDQFGESSPFQVKISCGRELQFIAKRQLLTPSLGVKIPAARPAGAEEDPAPANAQATNVESSDEGEPADASLAAEEPNAPSVPTPEEPPPFLSPVN